ncbi:MAG TPA: MoaD/ThiS family protein [Acidimicrobiales bacterium]|nr:MoaD/ThiS family protein [Acidimicrobiales bacterium]
MIRVRLPHHLSTLAGVGREIQLDVDEPPTQRRLIDALEATYPELRGTIRDPATQQRRPFIRFYAGEEDLSLEPPDAPLPAAVAGGSELLHVVGAMAGG